MKPFLHYQDDSLRFGEKSTRLEDFAISGEGPAYVYDLSLMASRLKAMREAIPGAKIFFALKANSHPKVLEALRQAGGGADVVSGGEIRRAKECGYTPDEIIYSGVGKTDREIALALHLEIAQLNVESIPELERIGEIARRENRRARIAFRLNPDVDIRTHPYIATGLAENKFGMELSQVPRLEAILAHYPNELELVGVSLHLGSQMLEFDGLREALRRLRPVYESLQTKFPTVRRFDAGGGLGIVYDSDEPAREQAMLLDYAKVLDEELKGLKMELQLEPGRWLVGHAGVLLTQVLYVKETPHRSFLIVDSGMNHLIRPALYEAYHRILPLRRDSARASRHFDVVGPICESADFFAKQRLLPEVKAGDWLAIADTGAYGFTMANTYNLQDLPREIVV